MSDQRATPRTGIGRVHITILRDNFPPVFTRNPYNTGTTENTAAGTIVTTVLAQDQDLRVNICCQHMTIDFYINI